MVAIIQASLGGFDNPKHQPQTYPNDHFLFTDDNFPPRISLTPRLQAKIPKLFAWQLKPDYQYYLWLDGNITLHNPETLSYLMTQIEDSDMLFLRHPRRPNVRQEIRYLRKGLREQSMYLVSRYAGEFLPEQTSLIQHDKEFKDDFLVNGGLFLYKNTPQVQAMMKEWWYHITRYNIQDQISLPYVVSKMGLKTKILEHDINNWDYIKVNGHAKRHA